MLILLASIAGATDFEVTIRVTTARGREVLPITERVVISGQPQVIPLIWRGDPVAGLLTSYGQQVCLAFFDAAGEPVREFGGPGCTGAGPDDDAKGAIITDAVTITTWVQQRGRPSRPISIP